MDSEINKKWQLEVCGINKYHAQGYKGQNITVLCHEDSEHGKKAMQVLSAIAPGVNIVYARVEQKTSGGKLLKYNWVIDGQEYTFDEVMQKIKPDIISSSLISKVICAEREETIGAYIDSGQLIVVTSAGNEGDEGAFPMYPNGLVIGACQFYNNKTNIKYVPYSGRTRDKLDISYVGFMWDWGGTSAAVPFVAGQIALFMSRFGKVSQKKFQRLIKPYCKDLGESDKDWIYGDGLIVLPDIDILMAQKEAFTDTKGHFAEEAIKWGKDINIINGFEDGSFRPEEPVTRGQLLAILKRYDERCDKS